MDQSKPGKNMYLTLKHPAQIEVTRPTSWSFLRRPRDSMGNLWSMRKSLPPYSTNPMAANTDTAARVMSESTYPKFCMASSVAMQLMAHKPPWTASEKHDVRIKL